MSKNTTYIIVIVLCFLAAGVVAYKYVFSGGGPGLSDDQITWVECNNPACKAEYQIGMKTYFEQVEARMNPLAMTATPAITCDKCGKESVYQAEKCANPDCGVVFIKGISGAEYLPDRCPECGHSAIKDSREKRKAERQ